MIKKLALFTTSLLLFASPAFVEAQTDKEILFRDIPWGTNLQDAESQIPEMSFLYQDGSRMDDQFAYGINWILDTGYDMIEVLGTGGMDMNYSGDLKVAGHKIQNVILYYATQFKDTGVDFNNCDLIVYGGKYYFDFSDIDATSRDLLHKLTDLYGEPDFTKKTGSTISLFQWDGLNGTHCSLSIDEGIDAIAVSYAWDGGEEIAKKAESLISGSKLIDELSLYGNGDNSGL